MRDIRQEALDIAKEFTLETIKNSANKSIMCSRQHGQATVEYFNTIYDGILSKLHTITEKE